MRYRSIMSPARVVLYSGPPTHSMHVFILPDVMIRTGKGLLL